MKDKIPLYLTDKVIEEEIVKKAERFIFVNKGSYHISYLAEDLKIPPETLDEILKKYPKKFKKTDFDAWELVEHKEKIPIANLIESKEEKTTTFISEKPDEESLKILTDPKLLDIIDNEFDKKIVGEKPTRRIVLVVSGGARLVIKAHATSGNLLVNDEGGIGKDHVVNNVLDIYPKGIVEHKKRISPTAFTYWHNHHFEPNWCWDDKVFYGEDTPNCVLNSDPFKVMASAERGVVNESEIVIKQKSYDVGIFGKPSMILTMATSNPKSEMLRRFPTIECDERITQTKDIVKRIAELKEKGINPEYDGRITKALGFLKPVRVRIPFAKGIAEAVSCDHIIMRTNFHRFLDYIAFSTALHQYQRERDKEGNLLATKQDYEIGGECIKKITSNIRSVPMTKKQREIVKVFRGIQKQSYSIKELTAEIQFLSERQLYRELDKMTELGFLKRGTEIRYSSINDEGEPSGTKREISTYKLIEFEEFELPKWKDIENVEKSVNSVKDDNNVNSVNNVNQETSSVFKEERGGKEFTT